jgi:hypothetical protein
LRKRIEEADQAELDRLSAWCPQSFYSRHFTQFQIGELEADFSFSRNPDSQVEGSFQRGIGSVFQEFNLQKIVRNTGWKAKRDSMDQAGSQIRGCLAIPDTATGC